jgi:hypothetical protein
MGKSVLITAHTKVSQKKMQEFSHLYAEVEIDLVKKGKPLTNQNLMTGLAKKGFKGDRFLFYRIQKKWQENSNFVISIAETQYSAMIEDIWNKLKHIEDQSLDLAGRDWTEIKTREGDGTEGSSYTETTPNQYKPKHDFLKLAKEVQKEKRELLKGDVINVSVAMLEKKFQMLRDESEAKSQEISHLKKKLKANQNRDV